MDRTIREVLTRARQLLVRQQAHHVQLGRREGGHCEVVRGLGVGGVRGEEDRHGSVAVATAWRVGSRAVRRRIRARDGILWRAAEHALHIGAVSGEAPMAIAHIPVAVGEHLVRPHVVVRQALQRRCPAAGARVAAADQALERRRVERSCRRHVLLVRRRPLDLFVRIGVQELKLILVLAVECPTNQLDRGLAAARAHVAVVQHSVQSRRRERDQAHLHVAVLIGEQERRLHISEEVVLRLALWPHVARLARVARGPVMRALSAVGNLARRRLEELATQTTIVRIDVVAAGGLLHDGEAAVELL